MNVNLFMRAVNPRRRINKFLNHPPLPILPWLNCGHIVSKRDGFTLMNLESVKDIIVAKRATYDGLERIVPIK